MMLLGYFFLLQLVYLVQGCVKSDQENFGIFFRFQLMGSSEKVFLWNGFEYVVGKNLKYFFYYFCEFSLFYIIVLIDVLLI